MPMGQHPPRIYPVRGSSSFIGISSAFFCPCGFGRFFQVNLGVARNDAHKVPGFFSVEHERFEYPSDVLAELSGHMGGCEVILVDFIRNQLIRDARPVKQARYVGFRREFRSFHLPLSLLSN